MLRSAFVLLALLLPVAATAQERSPIHLRYSVYAAGMNVVDIDSRLDLATKRYRVDLAYRTVGFFSLIIHNQSESFAEGALAAQGPQPLRFASWGTLRGTPRRTVIDYINGQPLLREQVPQNDNDREPVPVSMQHGTTDTLSAIVELVREASDKGRCDGQGETFDGRRLLQITSRTVGEERLATEGRSVFSGPALRCDFAGRQLAGFQPDDPPEDRAKIHHYQAWLAPLTPGGPRLPVRVVFETRFFGHATAYLTEASGGAGGHRPRSVSPGGEDAANTGAGGGADVVAMIAGHERAARCSPGGGDRRQQVGWIRLAGGKTVTAADRGEVAADAQRREQVVRRRLRLVRANGEPPAGGGKAAERGINARIGAGLAGEVGAVVAEKIRQRLLILPVRAGGEGAAHQCRGAVADHASHLRARERRQPAPPQHAVQRRRQIRHRVGQRSIEVKYQRASRNHYRVQSLLMVIVGRPDL